MANVTGAVWAASALGLAAGGLVYASAWPGSQLFGQTLIAGSDPAEIALTFDDGPNQAVTPQLLDLLARHGIRATFFCIGSRVRALPELTRRLVAEGHVVGNHTMHHPRLSIVPAARVHRELAECSAAIEDVTGVAVRLFRPPFGARRPIVLRAARALGLTTVMWNVIGFDWKPIGADKILRIMQKGVARNRRLGRGSNVVLHDGGHLALGAKRSDTVTAVSALIAQLAAGPAAGGMRYVTIDVWGPATEAKS